MALDEALTGKQNLLLFAALHGYSQKDAHLLTKKLLRSYDLEEAGERTVATYSGGMRRRLDLAAGILPQPKVMFLDEPTTGLDPNSRRELWNKIRGFAKQGMTVLLTTQYLEEADALADRIGFIFDGRIIAVGTPEELKASIGEKTLCASWVFALIGSIAKRTETVSGTSMMIVYPLLFASNVLVDTSTMPGWLQAGIVLNPISIAVNLTRDLLQGTPDAAGLISGIGVGLMLAAVFAPLTMYVYLKKQWG